MKNSAERCACRAVALGTPKQDEGGLAKAGFFNRAEERLHRKVGRRQATLSSILVGEPQSDRLELRATRATSRRASQWLPIKLQLQRW
jgi:hypothetical protein